MFKRFFNLIVFGLFADDGSGSTGTVKKPDDKPVDKGTDDPKGSDDPKPDDDTKNKIPYDRFKKVNDENKALKDDLAKRDKEKADIEKKQLEDQGKWQEAAELAEKRATEAEEKATKAETSKIDKAREYEIGLEAKNQGINDIKDAIKLINIDDVIANEDGTFSGIKKAIEKLKTDKPYLFNSNGNSPGVHSDKPKGTNTMTREELLSDPIVATKLRAENPGEYDRIIKIKK